jgi:glucokinase
MILAGDIGGTNARLAYFQSQNGHLSLAAEGVFPSREHRGLDEIVAKFVDSQSGPPDVACFGIAGPVRNGKVETSNLPWTVEASRLASELKLPSAMLINDLEANAWGIPSLSENDLVALNRVKGVPVGNQGVISAGTGLGEAGLYWDGKGYDVFACEGGHCDFAPRTELEIELLRYLAARFGHVSYERIVSGPGLVNVYRFLRDTGRGEESPWLTEELAHNDPAAVISRNAVAGKSVLAEHALDLWISIYGAEAGNLASPPSNQPDGTPYRDGQCAPVVYVGFGDAAIDVVRGPVHTNDPQIWVCGAPEFTGRVEATGEHPLAAYPLDGCIDHAVAPTVMQVPVIPLPTSVTAFAAITPLAYRFVGPASIELDGPTMKVVDANGQRTMAVPTRGLVFVTGPLTVHGQGRDVTLVSTESVTIDRDLVGGVASDGSNLGLVAGEDIIFDKEGDLTVQASLLASNGTVYNKRFRDPVSGSPPKLTVRGAVVARFHPVAGVFERATGTMVSGMVTDLGYPDPPPNPPYFLEPVRAQWERVDMTEIAMSDNDQTDGITPAPTRGMPAASPGCSGPAPTPYNQTYLRGCLYTP